MSSITLHTFAHNPIILLDKKSKNGVALSKSEKKELSSKINEYLLSNAENVVNSKNDVKALKINCRELKLDKSLLNYLSFIETSPQLKTMMKTVSEAQLIFLSVPPPIKDSPRGKHYQSVPEILMDAETAEEDQVVSINKNPSKLAIFASSDSEKPFLTGKEVVNFIKKLGKERNKLTHLDLSNTFIEPKELKNVLNQINRCSGLSKIVFNTSSGLMRRNALEKMRDYQNFIIIQDNSNLIITKIK